MEKINMILGMLKQMLELAEENKKIREEYSKLLEKNRVLRETKSNGRAGYGGGGGNSF